MGSELALTLKNLFLPVFCKACSVRLLTEENGFFCPTCWEQSPRIERPFCTICGRPHQGAVGFGTRSNFPCAECRAQTGRAYRRIYGAAHYDGAVKEAVKLFKFSERPRLARPLGELMAEFAEEEIDTGAYDCLVPVPLHRVRRRERGYNQSELLVQELAPLFPNARVDTSLSRVRPTRTQSRIKDPKERIDNVVGAFAVHADTHLDGQCVLLIDDVITTGGTASECANALRRAGAAAIDVFATTLALPPGTIPI